jgi:hypothetical protein
MDVKTGLDAAARAVSGLKPPSSTLWVSNGMRFDLVDAISAMALIAPFLLAFSMIMISVINTNVKGLIYLSGLLLLFILVYLFQKTIGQRPVELNNFCSLFSITSYSVPSFNSALYLYTIIYVLLPMVTNDMINFPLIIVFLTLYVLDSIIKIRNKCTPLIGIVMGSIIGAFFGIIWFLIIRSTGHHELLYYDDLISNRIACSRPTKQKFKCQVYKNGELIQNI